MANAMKATKVMKTLAPNVVQAKTISDKEPLRVIIYGAGVCNLLAVRLMHERGIKVVGAISRPNPSKVGKDVGELAGLKEKLGVIVSDNPEEVLAAVSADVVIVGVYDDVDRMLPILTMCLEHGFNVNSIGAEHSYSWRSHPEATAKLDQLAKKRGVTLTGTGNQDFYNIEGITGLAGTCNRIDKIIYRSLQDANLFGKEPLESNFYVGKSKEDFESLTATGKAEPSPFTNHWDNVAAGLGFTVQEIKQTVEPIFATEPRHCKPFARDIPAGQIIGTQTILEIQTVEGVSFRAEYGFRILSEGEEVYKEWEIQGEPTAQKLRATQLDGLTTTVTQCINRIPDIVAAPAGYVTSEQLPKLKFRSQLSRL